MLKKNKSILFILIVLNLFSCNIFNNGKLEVLVKFPSDIIAAPEIVLSINPKISGQETITESLEINNTEAIYENEEIPIGNYSITLTLRDEDLVFWELEDDFKIDPMTKTLVKFDITEDKFTSKPLYPPVFDVVHSDDTKLLTTLTNLSLNSSIYYDLEPKKPNLESSEGSKLYAAPTNFLLGDIVHAATYKENWETSKISSFNFIRPETLPIITNKNTDPFATKIDYEIANADPELSLYYTTDKTFPQPKKAKSLENKGIVEIKKDKVVLTAVTHKPDFLTSNSVKATSHKMPVPKFSNLKETLMPETFEITLTNDVGDAVIYYTNDETNPNKDSAHVAPNSTITFNTNKKIIAVATKIGSIRSDFATFSSNKGKKPLIEDARSNLREALQVKITAAQTEGIYYTEDGADPYKDIHGTLFAGPFNPDSATILVKAKAYYADSMPSDVISQEIATLAAPEIELGLFNKLTVKQEEAGKIYYTIDGTNPSDSGSSEYGKNTQLPQDALAGTDVKVLAAKKFAFSSTAELNIASKIDNPELKENRTDGNYFKILEVLIDTEAGAESYYTLDGTNPFESSSRVKYETPVLVEAGKIIKALSTAEAVLSSGTEEVDGTRLASPEIVFNIAGKVEITSADAGEIFYTDDGSDPSFETKGAETKPYIGAFDITGPTTIKAIIVDELRNPSLISEKLIDEEAAIPSFTDERASSKDALSIGITTNEASGTSFYTIDDSNPLSGAEYAGPFAPGLAPNPVRAISKVLNKLPSQEAVLAIDKNSQAVLALGKLNLLSIELEENKEIYYADNADPLTTGELISEENIILELAPSINLRAIKVDKLQTGTITEIKHASDEIALSASQSSTPTLTDARAGNYFEQLRVSVSVVGTEETYYTVGEIHPYKAGIAASTLVETDALVAFDEITNFQNTEVAVLASEITSIDGTRLEAPVIILNENDEIEITSTDGGNIYYTTDGTDPSFDTIGGTTTLYQASVPVPISNPTTVKAIIVDELKNPSLITVEEFNTQIDDLIFYDARDEKLQYDLIVGMIKRKAEDKVYYTTNQPGSTPTSSDIEYDDETPITTATINLIRAKAFSQTCFNSEIAELDISTVLTPPVIDITEDNLIEITADAEDRIYYTLDGTSPINNEAALIYSAPFHVESGTFIKAIATRKLHKNSDVVDTQVQRTPQPTIHDNRLDYREPLEIHMSLAEAGGTIYYTLDGTEPSNTSSWTSSGIAIDASSATEVRAFAKLPGQVRSETVIQPIPALPAPEVILDIYDVITISSIHPMAILYYTDDGSGPEELTAQTYSAPFGITNPTQIKALASAELCHVSGETDKTFDTQTDKPTISPTGLTTYYEEKAVNIIAPATAPSAKLYYSLDQGVTWEEYLSPIFVTNTETEIYAKAQALDEFASEANIQKYTIKVKQPTAPTVINNEDGTFKVQLAVATEGASIYYLISNIGVDITPGNAGEILYTGGHIVVPAGDIISYRAFKENWTPSDKSEAIMN